MRATCRGLLISGLLLIAPLAVGQPASDLDQVLEGFDSPVIEGSHDDESTPELEQIIDGFDEPEPLQGSAQAPSDSHLWTLEGALSLSTVYNLSHSAPQQGGYDYRGLSRLRTTFDLALTVPLGDHWKGYLSGYGFYDGLYGLRGRDRFSSAVVEALESESELREYYLLGSPSTNLDIKLGRQIVVWGKSDNLRVTDVLNPLDLREPGMVDIEDLRLPLLMARADYYIGDWGLSAFVIPEIRFDRRPPYGSDFNSGPTPPPTERVPSDGGSHTEYALAANGIFAGWDLSLYWADIYADSPHKMTTSGVTTRSHSRLKMMGSAANIALGNWLLKGELALFDGVELDNMPGLASSTDKLLLGAEYSGFRDTTLSLEVARHSYRNYHQAMESADIEQQSYQGAVRYSGEFLHQRLKLTMVSSLDMLSLDNGGFSRVAADYQLRDALTLTGGMVLYRSGDRPPTKGIDDNDRLFINIKSSF